MGLCILSSLSAKSQDVEKVIEQFKQRLEKPIQINGSIQAGASFYNASGIPNRGAPFAWNINARANLDIYQVNIPVSFILTSQQQVFNYQIPSYRFIGLSPSYKWATLHLGDRNLFFSRYTLSGHGFFGAGVELKPGNFRFSAMYGRLRRAIPEDVDARQSVEPAYQRMGGGFKTGYDDGKNRLELILFKADDRQNSIPQLQENPEIRPAENTVVGLTGSTTFGPVTLSADYALSALTRDKNAAPEENERQGFFRTFGGMVTPKQSTGYHNAFNTEASFRTTFGNINLGFERVDPGYRSMGTLFFNNDMENYTVGTNASLFKNKVSLNANLGIQRTNLRENESQTNNRLISSINLTYSPNQRWMLNATHSNFRTTNRQRSLTNPFQPVDSIVLVLTNSNTSFNGSYDLSGQGRSVLSFFMNHNRSNNILNDEVQEDQQVDYLMGNLSHQLSFQSGLSLQSTIMADRVAFADRENVTLSGALSASQRLFNNALSITSGITYSLVNAIDNPGDGRLINWRFSARWTFLKQHRLVANLHLIDRNQEENVTNLPDFTETRGRIEYSWSF